MLLVSRAALPIRFFPRVAADHTNIMHDSMTMPPTVVALDVFGGNYMQTFDADSSITAWFIFEGFSPCKSWGICRIQAVIAIFRLRHDNVKQVKDPKSWCSSLFWRSFGFECPLA